MRTAELINFVFFSFLIALAWQRPLGHARRVKVMTLGAAAIVLLLSVQFINRLFSPLTASVIRDWLPALLMLVAYRTAGMFFTAPDEKLQNRLMRFDRKVLGQPKEHQSSSGLLRWIAACIELAYLLCYPLVPFGLGALYLAHMGRYADEFWTIVLLSAYLCYVALPFAQTLPPRMLTSGREQILPPTKIRELNLWILRYGSIHANTFPSAHVAIALSVSAALLYLLPLAGIGFLCISLGIAIGVVLGRYHYAADALTGAALAIAVFLTRIICF
jgi:hypothetical protein